MAEVKIISGEISNNLSIELAESIISKPGCMGILMPETSILNKLHAFKTNMP
jgi:hypothetical protein